MQTWHAHRGLLGWQCPQVCQHPLPIKHMAEGLQCQGSQGTDKGTAGSMGVSAGVGPAARMGSATAAGTAEVDGPSEASIDAAAGGSRR